MSKRRADGGIKAAFALQAQRAEAGRQTADWPPLESSAAGVTVVPDNYLQEVTQKGEDYVKRRATFAKAVAKADKAAAAARPEGGSRSRGAAAATAAAAAASQAAASPAVAAAGDGGGGALADQQRALVRWQGQAAFCVQTLGMWPGSGVALPLPQQELLLHVVANHGLHLDPGISPRACQLLLQALRDHPPVRPARHAAAGQPPALQCATLAGQCWDLGFTGSGTFPPLLQDARTPFELLQQLVRNAVLLVRGPGEAGGSGGGAARPGPGPGPDQGQALLLLCVTELLQADLLARQAAFEQLRQLAGSLDTDAARDEAARRAATVLQHSLLYRVMQDDSIGGDTWKFFQGQSRGKHQLVRDLLALACCAGDEAGAAAPRDALHALRGAAAEAAPPGSLAAAGQAEAVAPTSPADLVGVARRLLLLLLQLFSCCEEAGVYGGAGAGRHHMQRSIAGAAQPNDRLELDEVMMQAIGTVGHTAAHRMPELQPHAALAHLLQALPAVHRVRLLSLMVVEGIKSRLVDPESEGKLGTASYNQHVQALKDYCFERGKGVVGFRQPHALEVLRAVDVRLEWCGRELFCSSQLFPLLMGAFISAAAQQQQQEPAAAEERQAFAEVSRRILQHALQQHRNNMAAALLDGAQSDALLAVAGALQSLHAPA